MLATDRTERLYALTELTRLAHMEHLAQERGDHKLARTAALKMQDVVTVLGFDPLAYRPGRDVPETIMNRRSLAMLRALPGTSAQIAQAVGVQPNHVRAYLIQYVERGEVTMTKDERGRVTWAVAA